MCFPENPFLCSFLKSDVCRRPIPSQTRIIVWFGIGRLQNPVQNQYKAWGTAVRWLRMSRWVGAAKSIDASQPVNSGRAASGGALALEPPRVRVYTDVDHIGSTFGGTIDIDICSTFAGLFNRHWHFFESVPNFLHFFSWKCLENEPFCVCVCLCVYIYIHVYQHMILHLFNIWFWFFWAFFPW